MAGSGEPTDGGEESRREQVFARARELRGEPGSAPYNILFLGTGVSQGMTDNNRLCNWVELVRDLASRLSGNVPTAIRSLANYANQDLEETSVLLGWAHMVREHHAKRWSEVTRSAFADLRNAFQEESPWAKFFSEMKERAKTHAGANLPLVFSTNYDDLLGRHLGLRLLFSRRRSADVDWSLGWHDREGEPPAPAHLRRIAEIPLIWDLHRKGLLEPEDWFVHHLHGSEYDPESIVFDAADYERVIMTQVFVPLAKTIAQPNVRVYFLGVGKGMFDSHLQQMWLKVESHLQKQEVAGGKFLWLAQEEERRTFETLKEKAPDRVQKALEIVSLPGFPWMCDWMREALDIK